eukprot:UN02423
MPQRSLTSLMLKTSFFLIVWHIETKEIRFKFNRKHRTSNKKMICQMKNFVFTKIHTLLLQKQAKNRNGTGSNLSLGTRLTVLSKRLGRKRCCDTTPDHCLEVFRLTIFA